MANVSTKVCPRCEKRYPVEKSRCPSCGGWSFSGPDEKYENGKDGSFLLEDIDEREVERISTGLFDECLGGGVVRSDVILIGGGPGAGKSTAMLQVAQTLCGHGLVLYIAAEEDIRTIKVRAARLNIDGRRQIRLLPALSGVANIGAVLWSYRPKFIIADSIDSLSGRNAEEELVILTVLKKFCVELSAPALVVSQINKAGDYAGLKAKQHAVDVLLTFDADPVETDPEGGDYIRIAETIKNRSGRAGVKSLYAMTEHGLIPWEPESESEDTTEDL